VLQVTFPAREYTVENELGEVEFYNTKEQKVWLEHSLISIQKWEAKWHKPYLDPKLKMTEEESNDYIRCMVVKPVDIDESIFAFIPADIMRQINAYISNPMTASTVTVNKKRDRPTGNKRTTAETLYWEMIELGIPYECRTWHLNQLLALIKYCDLKNGGGGKMSRREQAEWQRSKMAAARAKHKKR